MNLKDLKELLQILEEKEIAEFELEEEGMKLRVRKAEARVHAPGAPSVGPAASAAPRVASHEPAALGGGSVPAAAATPFAAPLESDNGLAIVKSPIVGTFFRSPDPNSAPFVNVGDRVRVGQVLCIIEAMKLMNEIEAEVAGEITRVHHENGQPVQFGEPLFSIRLDG